MLGSWPRIFCLKKCETSISYKTLKIAHFLIFEIILWALSCAYGGLSSNWLRRPFSLVKLHRDQTLFFPLSYRERVGFILLVISQNFNDSALITLLLCSHCVASKFAELFLLVNSTFSTFPGGSQLPMLKMLFS